MFTKNLFFTAALLLPFAAASEDWTTLLGVPTCTLLSGEPCGCIDEKADPYAVNWGYDPYKTHQLITPSEGVVPAAIWCTYATCNDAPMLLRRDYVSCIGNEVFMVDVDESQREAMCDEVCPQSVSYTHLTLPTKA